MPGMRKRVLDHAGSDQDQLDGRQLCRLSLPRERLRRSSHLGKGEEMRITLLGVLSIVAAFLLLAYVGQQAERKWNKAKERDEQARNNEGHNPDETGSL